MRGTNTVLELMRHRRPSRTRCPGRINSEPTWPDPDVEGVIYLTPDGDGYILYASPSPAASPAKAVASH